LEAGGIVAAVVYDDLRYQLWGELVLDIFYFLAFFLWAIDSEEIAVLKNSGGSKVNIPG
jgi:hypothetical protein